MSETNQDAQPIKDTLSVLIVEDNPLFQDQIREACHMLASDPDIAIAASGSQYDTIIADRSMPFDVALIDLGLPDISGINIIRDLRQRSTETVILVISVITNQDMVISAIRAGARGYILKGETQSAIRDAIQDVMAGNYPISPAIARYLFRLAGQETSPVEPAIELTAREDETLRLIASGSSYAEAARTLNVSLSTVQTYIRSLYRKLGAHSQVQAVNKARSAGFLD